MLPVKKGWGTLEDLNYLSTFNTDMHEFVTEVHELKMARL